MPSCTSSAPKTRRTTPATSCRPTRRSELLDDVASIALEQLQELRALRVRDAVVDQCGAGVLHVAEPLVVGDAQTLMRCLHVASDIDARASAELADLVDKQLPCAVVRVDAAAGAESGECRIGAQRSEHVVNHRGEHVVTAQGGGERR